MNRQTSKSKALSSGFQCPWHVYQVLTYIYFAFSSLVFFLKILPYSKTSIKVPYLIFFLIISTLIIYYTILLTKSNPTDPEVIAYKKNLQRNNSNLKSEKIWCHDCDAPVTSTNTKHCKRCNRCVLDIDHHCKFVNNCVAKSNYRHFFKLIVVAKIFLMFLLSTSLIYVSKKSVGFEYSDIFVYLLGISSFLSQLSILRLIIFHIKIQYKGITTFEYLEAKIKAKQVSADSQVLRNISTNRINPIINP